MASAGAGRPREKGVGAFAGANIAGANVYYVDRLNVDDRIDRHNWFDRLDGRDG